jgi:hypothetical protein
MSRVLAGRAAWLAIAACGSQQDAAAVVDGAVVVSDEGPELAPGICTESARPMGPRRT